MRARVVRRHASAHRKVRNKYLSPPLEREEFVAYWLDSIAHWERFANRNESHTLLIRYGDLVKNPRQELGRICDFLEIGWDDILLRPTRNGSLWSGNSMHGTQFTGISTSSLGRYRQHLSEKEIRFLEGLLARTMCRYGWELEYSNISYGKELHSLLFSKNTKLYHKAKALIGFFWQSIIQKIIK